MTLAQIVFYIFMLLFLPAAGGTYLVCQFVMQFMPKSRMEIRLLRMQAMEHAVSLGINGTTDDGAVKRANAVKLAVEYLDFHKVPYKLKFVEASIHAKMR